MATKLEPRGEGRAPVRIPVSLCTDPQGVRAKGDAVITNMSRKGLGLDTQAELKSGDLLYLKVAVPVSLLAQVRYVKNKNGQYCCGATIEKIGFLDNLKLKRFVKAEIEKTKSKRS